MYVRADVTCYCCGHVAGTVEGEYATLARIHLFHPRTQEDSRAEHASGVLRCPRCQGPVFLEGVETIRKRQRVELTAADFADLYPRRRRSSSARITGAA